MVNQSLSAIWPSPANKCANVLFFRAKSSADAAIGRCGGSNPIEMSHI